jgi:selenide, water dikinase
MEDIKLTQYSHGAGCGCKISPAVLDAILQSDSPAENFAALLVGNETKDDAAVYDPGDGNCIISTTDFFMPIVDDAFTFGQIASVNAISDVYAMGGKPLMALAILGWPVGKLSNELAQQVLEGARKICRQANIPLAGGHSIDSPEPIFGLAVTGTVRKENLKRNSTATERSLAEEKDMAEAVRWMTELNTLGAELGALPYVKALTDVTGFGLLGHLIEVCEGSGVSAEIQYGKIPLLRNLSAYTSKFIYPDNTMRNWQSYEKKVSGIGAESLLTLCDPQTSGGLLICVDAVHADEFESRFGLTSFGKLVRGKDVTVEIR